MKITKKDLEKMVLNEMMSINPVDVDSVSSVDTDKEILRLAIIAELDATSLYEQLAAKTTNEKIKKVLLDIAKEEKTHVGEFQALLLDIDEEQKEELEKGKEEVDGIESEEETEKETEKEEETEKEPEEEEKIEKEPEEEEEIEEKPEKEKETEKELEKEEETEKEPEKESEEEKEENEEEEIEENDDPNKNVGRPEDLLEIRKFINKQFQKQLEESMLGFGKGAGLVDSKISPDAIDVDDTVNYEHKGSFKVGVILDKKPSINNLAPEFTIKDLESGNIINIQQGNVIKKVNK